jgi:hypothetical protein
LRLSVVVENVCDLIANLDAAFAVLDRQGLVAE